MTGKEKCRALRSLRMKAAELNEIDFQFEECTHEGPCKGVCAFCDRELKELEKLIEARRAEGLPVHMEYLFPVPAPELPHRRESLAARLKRMLARAKKERPAPQTELIMGKLSDEQAKLMKFKADFEEWQQTIARELEPEIMGEIPWMDAPWNFGIPEEQLQEEMEKELEEFKRSLEKLEKVEIKKDEREPELTMGVMPPEPCPPAELRLPEKQTEEAAQ